MAMWYMSGRAIIGNWSQGIFPMSRSLTRPEDPPKNIFKEVRISGLDNLSILCDKQQSTATGHAEVPWGRLAGGQGLYFLLFSE
jgi:hypothetical protein